MSATPDHVCKKYAQKKIKVTIRPLASDGDVLLIEGEREGLEFLGNLLLAQAKSEDCGLQLGLNGAGKTFFTRASTAGLYIHRLHREPTPKSKNNSKPGRMRKQPPAASLI